MTAIGTTIPNDATITFHQADGIDVTITWQLMSDEIMAVEAGDHFVLPAVDEVATPTLAFGTATDGFFSPETGVLVKAVGGVEAERHQLVGADAIASVNANVGITADTASAQGGDIITSSYNVVSTAASAGDSLTLPAVFGVGTLIYIKNDAAANSIDIFPASGDDAGGGANTAVAIANGEFAVFIATVANATWTKLLET